MSPSQSASPFSPLPLAPSALSETLDHCAMSRRYTVVTVQAPATSPEWRRQLEEIGFIPGEQVMLLSRGLGGGPLAVRVGDATFALRQAEAACITVRPSDPSADDGDRR